jgi:sortase A
MNTLRQVLMALGIAAVGYAGGVVAYGGISQRYASWKFDEETALAADRVPAMEGSRVDVHEGDRVGRLEIARLGLSVMVFQGIEESALAAGAGHVPGTPPPGGDGNVVIAAHRDTYFRKLSGILAGDRIRVITRLGTYEYVVESSETVDPEDTQVMESRDRNELTLITCYPFYFVGSAPRRFIVHARYSDGS